MDILEEHTKEPVYLYEDTDIIRSENHLEYMPDLD